METKMMIDSAYHNLIDSKILTVMFWCAVLTFAFASACGLASVQAWSGLAVAFAGISYVESRVELQKAKVKIAERMGFDHIVKR